MNLDLSGRTAVVCGSTRGIGWASAVAIAELGARIVLAARNEEMLQQRVSELPAAAGRSHQYLVADFSNPGQLETRIREWVDQGHRAEILVNNTGGPPPGTALDASLESYRIAFNNHLVCNQILVQTLVPGMREAGFGRIINIISIGVKIPIPGLGVSNTIRGAVASWGKTLAGELAADGITVNNMLPGLTWTERLQSLVNSQAEQAGKPAEEVMAEMQAAIPAGRFGEASEAGNVVAFLASPAAAYINGINIPVDGGRTPCL
jgi:3-oxoacyl-[acyl-carrier protein] reductase